MKVLAVLALAVFSSCQANILYADAPKPRLDVLTDAFLNYVAKATQTDDDTVAMIRKTQFAQDVRYVGQDHCDHCAHLTERASAAGKYAVTLREKLPPAARYLITKVTSEPDVLRERVNQALSTVREKLEPYIEDMKPKIQQRVEQLKQELAPYVESMDTEALSAALMQKSKEFKANLEKSVKDLQARLEPYTDDLKLKVKQHLEEFKERVATAMEKAQVEMDQRA